MRGGNFSNVFSSSENRTNEGLRGYMVYVYQYMSGALGLSGILAFLTSYLAMTNQEFAYAIYGSPLKYLVMFAPLGISLFFGFKFQSMSLKTTQTLFWVFAGAMGISLSSIFLVYTGSSIARSFFVTAITFLSMSIYGYATKRDLSGFGSFLMMGVVGIVIASIVNMFMKSSGLDFMISILAVLIFTGLTAYNVQQIKSSYYAYESGMVDGSAAKKFAVMSALSLYMDFVNIFISLLRLFGEKRD